MFNSFAQLQQELSIPNGWHYRYFQLGHSREDQLGLREVHLYNSKLECALHSPEQARWLADVPELTPDNWQEVSNSFFDTVLSARGKRIQLRYIHTVYYAPKQFFIHKKGVRCVTNKRLNWMTLFTWFGPVPRSGLFGWRLPALLPLILSSLMCAIPNGVYWKYLRM